MRSLNHNGEAPSISGERFMFSAIGAVFNLHLAPGSRQPRPSRRSSRKWQANASRQVG